MLDTNDIQALREAGTRWLRKGHRTLTKDEHEDILQDALIELVRAEAIDPGPLLGKIIDRRAADLVRRKVRRAKVEVSAGDATDLSVLSDRSFVTIDGAIFASDFNRALRGLDEDTRAAFILNELRGLTKYEAALILGISPGTLAGRVDRAKKLLREEL